MSRRTIRELSVPIVDRVDANGISDETKKKWMRKGGKRRIRRLERREGKQEVHDER